MKPSVLISGVTLLCILFSCIEQRQLSETDTSTPELANTFQSDLDFLNKYLEVHLLEEPGGNGMIAISPALQARVMTSSSHGPGGRSYGWINRALFESGDTLAHINPFGGEERFWLGPEGGQFSIFFPEGTDFTFENWQTPALIDLEPFEVKSKSLNKASYSKNARFTNYAGYTFEIDIQRNIEILTSHEVFESLDLNKTESVKVVGYKSTNTLTNIGQKDWEKETGLLSIWLLGMFIPSDATTILLPFKQGDDEELGAVVNDSYFGAIPAGRLTIGPGVVYFRGDGNSRGKIGLSPKRAKDVIGSYDAISRTLTVVKYSKPEHATYYVNSLWEIQKEPYQGDVVNSYNDGPLDGGKPLGPFYELETSSPALSLKTGESGTHIQNTYHFEGDASQLGLITHQLFGVSIKDITTAFDF
jgi:hypothetical protein